MTALLGLPAYLELAHASGIEVIGKTGRFAPRGASGGGTQPYRLLAQLPHPACQVPDAI